MAIKTPTKTPTNTYWVYLTPWKIFLLHIELCVNKGMKRDHFNYTTNNVGQNLPTNLKNKHGLVKIALLWLQVQPDP